jgi:hypothetical protein
MKLGTFSSLYLFKVFYRVFSPGGLTKAHFSGRFFGGVTGTSSNITASQRIGPERHTFQNLGRSYMPRKNLSGLECMGFVSGM